MNDQQPRHVWLRGVVEDAQADLVDDPREVAALASRVARLSPARSRWRAGSLVVGALAGAAVTTLVLAYRAPSPRPGADGVTLATGLQAPVPLAFADGSSIDVTSGSRVRVHELGPSRARIDLEDGRFAGVLVDPQKTMWELTAGPYRVEVLGARFELAWRASSSQLNVETASGSVMVRGPLLDKGMAVGAGQRLVVELGQARVSLAPAAEAPTVAPAPRLEPASPAAQPRRASRPHVEPPVAVAPPPPAEPPPAPAPESSASPAAVVVSPPALPPPSAEQLLASGDAARFARRLDEAAGFYQSVVERFPGTAQEADAVFALGVLETTRARWPQAARLFEEYRRRFPDGELAREASGRLIEVLREGGRRGDARAAARSYLERYPSGPHAAVAQRVLSSR